MAVLVSGRAYAEPAADAVVLTAETAEIVVAPGGTKTTDFTAQELKGLLGQILGGEIPVRKAATPGCVSVVLTNDVTMARDSFRIVSDPAAARVTIAGFDGPTDLGAVVRDGRYQSMRTAVGTLYGAYELLERRAGARFYFPGEIGTILPKAAKVCVPKGDVVRAPAFVNRNIYFNGDGAWLDGNPCGPQGRCSEKALHWLRLRLETFNIPCCHGQIGFDYRKRFAKTHPEYFALLPDRAQGGRLRRDNDPEHRLEYHPDQLCHSSGIWDVFADDIRAQRRGDRPATRGLARWGGNFGGRYVDIMPMDGMPKCRCAACEGWYAKAKDPKTQYATDLVWGNTAKLVHALNAEGIDATYTMMAYSCYRAIPDIALPSNILVMVAEGGPWHKHIPGKVAEEKAEIRAWAEKLNAKVRVWTYPGKYARYQAPNVPQMTPRAYADYFGDIAPILAGGFIETESDRFLYNYLNYYVFAWLAWHPDGDVKAMLDEHFRLMFGAAAPQLKRFYEELEDKWLKEVCVVAEQAGVPTDLSRRVPDILTLATKTYSPAVLADWDRLLDAAERAVADDPLSLKRVKFIRAEFLERMKAHFSGYLDSLDVAKARAARASLDPAKNLADESKARPAKTGTLTRDTTCFVTAPDSIRVDSSFMGWPGAYFDIGKTLPKLKPNATYRISYYLKYENVEPLTADSGVAVHINYRFRYGWMNPNIPFVGSHDWMFQSFDIKTGRNANLATFLAFGLIDAKGTVWFDDIRVEEIAE